MRQAKPAPDLRIPKSENTVSVSIVNASHIGGIPAAAFMSPSIPGFRMVDCPAYSFLVKRNKPSPGSKYNNILFDLGIRKDVENAPQAIQESILALPTVHVNTDKDVADILQEHGEHLKSIDGIIWSHYHFDHTGDPSRFPPSTDLLVGPGFKSAFVPAWPTVSDSLVDERHWAGRELVEIDFNQALTIGRFKALDFFGDGSFYLLDSPGHTVGHLCALARTSANPPEFMALGGDVAHHVAEFRPTEYLPLPDSLSPSPFQLHVQGSVCPGHVFEAIHPDGKQYATKPFMHAKGPAHEDAEAVLESVLKWEELDANENVLAVVAHDASLEGVMEYYPKRANGWKEKGWKKNGMWRFLGDFEVEKKE